MDGIFSLPYSEFSVIESLSKHLKKNEGFSVFVPVSRQQKGIDFLILNTRNAKVATFQVKSSRVYPAKEKNKYGFEYYMWLNNFAGKYEKGTADFYAIYGLYPLYDEKKGISSGSKLWKDIILCYPEKDMFAFLSNVKTKKGTPDKFFGYGFNGKGEISVDRGLEEKVDASEYLLSNRIGEIKRRLR
jgi:hypothetical protein